MNGWKLFNFFEQQEVEAGEGTLPASVLFSKIQSTCACRGIFVGDSKGMIHSLNSRLQCTLSFKAYYGRVDHLHFIQKKQILLSIGEEEKGIPTLKVWQISSADPVLVRTTKISHGNKIFPVTALACLDNLQQVAVGLENGVVILIRGDVSRDRHTKSKLIYEGSEMITCK